MMKKVLALVMVLSMVGFASAALQIDVVGGKAVVMGQMPTDQYLVLTAGNGASLSNFAKGAAAPDLTGYAGSLADFDGLAVYPAGFDGEVWVLASTTGNYPVGSQLEADLAVTKSQTTRMYDETIFEGAPIAGWFKIRSFTEVTDIVQGALSLSFFDESGNPGAMLAEKSLDARNVNTTFSDGEWQVPEPMTLSLLGLGALVLRRRS